MRIDQSSHKMYSNKILNFQESTTILNACTKKSGYLLKAPRTNGLPNIGQTTKPSDSQQQQQQQPKKEETRS